MRRRGWVIALAAVAALTVPGTAGLGGPAQAARSELGALEHVRIPSHDGVVLNGFVALPKGPKKNLPTVLLDTPYIGTCDPLGAACPFQPDWGDEVPAAVGAQLDEQYGSFWDEWDTGKGTKVVRFANSLGFPLIHLVRAGYAVAVVSVRGTGDSGGCFDFGARAEQKDAAFLVDWLARQPWSDHKVAMGGLSYLAYTTWQASVQAPAALRATITAGELTSPWEFDFTPQGARENPTLFFDTAFGGNYAAHLPGPGSHADFQPTLCPNAVVTQSHQAPELATDTRNRSYYAERDLRSRLRNARAAVLSAHGFADVAGHGFQDSLLWEQLSPSVPKRFVRGPWAHTWPSSYSPAGGTDTLNAAWGKPGWEAIVLEWLDAFLKNGPEPQRVGVMDFSDGTTWRSSTRGWSVPQEVLYLGDSALRTRKGTRGSTFRDVPVTSVNSSYGAPAALTRTTLPSYDLALCQPRTADGSIAALYESPVLTRPAVLAGNPFAYLNVSSNRPHGVVDVELYDLAPDARCADPASETGNIGIRWLSRGAADLEFYPSHFAATPFPVGSPQKVRIDLTDLAATIPAGHRIVAVLSYGSAVELTPKRPQDPPLITVGGTSELVLPVYAGTLGGRRPAHSYPPRPLGP